MYCQNVYECMNDVKKTFVEKNTSVFVYFISKVKYFRWKYVENIVLDHPHIDRGGMVGELIDVIYFKFAFLTTDTIRLVRMSFSWF